MIIQRCGGKMGLKTICIDEQLHRSLVIQCAIDGKKIREVAEKAISKEINRLSRKKASENHNSEIQANSA
jgi:hypothetical protein